MSLDGSVPDTSVSNTGAADSTLIDAQASDGSGPDTSSDAGTDGGGPDADVALSEVELLVVGDSWGQQVGGIREREGKGDFQHEAIPEDWAADTGDASFGWVARALVAEAGLRVTQVHNFAMGSVSAHAWAITGNACAALHVRRTAGLPWIPESCGRLRPAERMHLAWDRVLRTVREVTERGAIPVVYLSFGAGDLAVLRQTMIAPFTGANRTLFMANAEDRTSRLARFEEDMTTLIGDLVDASSRVQVLIPCYHTVLAKTLQGEEAMRLVFNLEGCGTFVSGEGFTDDTATIAHNYLKTGGGEGPCNEADGLDGVYRRLEASSALNPHRDGEGYSNVFFASGENANWTLFAPAERVARDGIEALPNECVLDQHGAHLGSMQNSMTCDAPAEDDAQVRPRSSFAVETVRDWIATGTYSL